MKRLLRKASSEIQERTCQVAQRALAASSRKFGSQEDPDRKDGARANASQYSAEGFGPTLCDIREELDAAASGRPISEASSQQLVEAIRQATEVLVWGERHDETLFDLFCETQVLASFVRALLAQSTPEVVQVQLLQTLSILVQNAHRSTSFFYLLSGGHLNTLLSGALDFEDDEVGHIYGALNMQSEEVLAYFLALVKGLALRLDNGSAQLCIDMRQAPSEAHGFPLFAQAVRFTTHKDAMVRTGARAALLSLLRIDSPKVRGHTVEAAMAMLVPSLAHALRVAWAAASAAVQLQDTGTLQMALEAEGDLLDFLNDLLLLDLPSLGEALAQGVLAGALLPLLVRLVPSAATEEPLAEDLQAERRPAVQDIERAIANQTAGLEPAQRGLVGAVVERVLGHTPSSTVSAGMEAKSESHQGEPPVAPASTSRSSMRLIPSGEAEDASPHAAMDGVPTPWQRAPPARAAGEDVLQEDEPRPTVTPSIAVAVRAVAACARALGTHRHVVEPLAKVLLWPTLPAEVVAAMHSPETDGTNVAAMLFGEDAVQTKSSSSSTIIGETDVAEPNPFRGMLLKLLGDGKSPAPAEAPIVAWTFLELQASLSPQLLEGTGLLLRSGRTRRSRGSMAGSTDTITADPGSPCSSDASQIDQEEAALPERLIVAICVHARLPRIAQRAVASALVDLVSPPQASATRQRTALAAGGALREAAELFRESIPCSAEDGISAASAIAAFLEEWEWHRHRHSPVDLPAVCGGVQCLLRSGSNCSSGTASATATERSGLATHAARSLLTLRRLCAELAALSEGAVQDEELDSCPLKVDLAAADTQSDVLEGLPTTEAAEVLECTEPGGEDGGDNVAFGYTKHRALVLHQTLLLVTEPPLGDGGVAVVRARMPVWQVVSAIDTIDPHLLRVRVLTATGWERSAAASTPKELVLHFKDIGDSTRALLHIEECRAQEAQRLLTQLDSFVDVVLSEAYALDS